MGSSKYKMIINRTNQKIKGDILKNPAVVNTFQEAKENSISSTKCLSPSGEYFPEQHSFGAELPKLCN